MGNERKNGFIMSISIPNFISAAIVAAGIYIIIVFSILLARLYIPYVGNIQNITNELVSEIKLVGGVVMIFILLGVIMTLIGIRNVVKLGRRNNWVTMLLLMWLMMSFSIVTEVYTTVSDPSLSMIFIPAGYLTNTVLTYFYLKGKGAKPTIVQMLKWWDL
ncbi:MAG: hypothetical protein QXT27_01765 [Pyrobaculum sp.]